MEAIQRRAQADGSVRVIVQLRVPPGPEDTREQRIRTVQQALQAELAHTSHKLLRIYTATPTVALDVSVEALAVLKQSRHIVHIEADELSRPF